MNRFALSSARILGQQGWLDSHSLIVEGARIAGIAPTSDLPSDIEAVTLSSGCLIPGFIDTQVNGGGGILFNDEPTVEGLVTMAAAHRHFGTTAMMPTLISDDLSKVAQAIAAVDEAIEQGVSGIIGIHIEGPFLNTAKKGIHDAAKFRTLDDAAIELLSSLRHGKTIVTLAPEEAPTGAIAKLVERGAIVSAAHSMASYEAMEAAIAEGLAGITHLFNAMTPMESRAPGMVGAGLTHPLFAGIIVDGHHVHAGALKAAYRAKGPDELMLVTDAMSTVSSDQTSFMLGGELITESDGALRSADGTLAGSTLSMDQALRNAVSMMGADLASASRMASGTPARFLDLTDRGSLSVGSIADLVHLDDEMKVRGVWTAGQSDRDR
jgi:N-acetylglucosamine-6-phosphate deacetylase